MIIARRALWLVVPLLLGVAAAACSAGTELAATRQEPGSPTDGAGAAVEETVPARTSGAPADQASPAAELLEIDSKWTKYSSLGESPAPELVTITR